MTKKEKIKKSDLENALKFQTEDFALLGEMAINENVLTREQVDVIMDNQRSQGGFFGDIAVKLGFLHKDEVELRLEIHNREKFLIGEKLVFFGAISRWRFSFLNSLPRG